MQYHSAFVFGIRACLGSKWLSIKSCTGKTFPRRLKPSTAPGAVSRQLPERYQLKIDRLAMELGLTGGDEYLNQWHWTAKLDREGTTAEVLESISRELMTQSDPKIPGKQR
jgi:hypothetical protein